MTHNSFHKKFQLNGNSFTSIDALLKHVEGASNSIHRFLKDWFNEEEYVIVQTSGSTGKPKLISLKKEFMKNSALATGDFFDLQENTKALLCLSVDYIAGKMMLVRALILGWQLDVVGTTSFPLRGIKKEYDFSAFVPMQLQNSLNQVHQIKKLIVGGGVVSKELEPKLQELETKIFATYGMTETITHIAVKKLNNPLLEKNMEKLPFYELLPNVSIYCDERNCLVIEAPKVSDELIITNDVIQLVSEREFEWLGRYDNVINSGGIKLHPEKIEKKLSQIIKERFFVIGIADEVLGEKLILIIEGKSQIPFPYVFENLTKFETPKEIHFVNQFIETETNKIQRKRTLEKIYTN